MKKLRLQKRKSGYKFRAFFDIYFVDSRKMRRLNKAFRGKDKPTNVLAFPANGFPRPDVKSYFLGEIYLCPSYINSHREDIKRLVIHGFLHLLGYTHKKSSDRIKMEDLEKKILTKISTIWDN